MVPAVFDGVAQVADPHVEENVNVIGPEGAFGPVNVVDIFPETGKQHVPVDHVTLLNVLVAVYLAKL